MNVSVLGDQFITLEIANGEFFVLLGPTLHRNDVKMHGDPLRRCHAGLAAVAEPAAHPGLEPGVPERRKPFLLKPDDPIQVRGRGHQVDHRLGGQTRHGRAPDVFHLLTLAGQRRPELGHQRRRDA